MLTAQRYPPGSLPTPAALGCPADVLPTVGDARDSRVSRRFANGSIAGTEPREPDTWIRNGRVILPAEYAEWASGDNTLFVAAVDAAPGTAGAGSPHFEASQPARWDSRAAAMVMSSPSVMSGSADTSVVARRFRIVAPLDGDVYRVPPGVPTSYATIPLLAAGGTGEVRWYVDDVLHHGARWALARGTHVIRAESPAGASSVRIRVE